MLRRRYSAKAQALKTSVPYGSTKVEYLESPFTSYTTGNTALFELGDYNIDLLNGDTVKFQTEHKLVNLPPNDWTHQGGEGFSRDGRTLVLSFVKNSRPIGITPSVGDKTVEVNGWMSSYDVNGGIAYSWDWAAFKPNQSPDVEWHTLTTSLSKDFHIFQIDDYITSSETRDNKTWNIPATLWVFGTWQKDSYYATKPLLGRKKFFKFWFNNKLTRYLIPSIDKTGTPCMFDLVSRKNFYNAGTGQFIYPTISTTYSLRRPQAEWAKMTDTGVHKIYYTPIGYEGSIEDYAIENGYKRLIEIESPNEEGKYYSFKWVETDDTLTTEWFEIEPPQEEIS